ncbi:MAG: hypothetical protein SNJ70_10405 [Armatimonadota bacterium]
MNTRFIFILVIIISISLLSGCAKYPDSPSPLPSGKLLIITMQVRGTINPVDQTDPSIRRHYFIAIDNDGDPNTGPWAAIFPPYGGNGWVTSRDPVNSIGLTSFIQYDAENQNGYLYRVLPGSYFLNNTSPQLPLRSELLNGGTTLRFTIDFSQIATSAIPADQIQQLDINFITTNKIAISSEPIANRQWDSLGFSGQDYVSINTLSNQKYEDRDPTGPIVTDPDLDIVYWSIEIQTISR